MIGTNRDLAAIKQIVHREIDRLQHLAAGTRHTACIERELSVLYRQRLAVSAALVNRRVEASNRIVNFSRWVSGNGALDVLARTPCSDTAPEAGWRRQGPV
ncbi:MAG: hypothetical protein ACM3JG_16255 [Thiohalocapsa sp.]